MYSLIECTQTHLFINAEVQITSFISYRFVCPGSGKLCIFDGISSLI